MSEVIKMKKTIALILVVVFILGLPASFAQRLLRDKVEDIKDIREDIRDRLNVDWQRCVQKCKNESGVNCEAKCKAADVKEDIRDKREDIREKLRIRKVVKVRNAQDLNVRQISAAEIAGLRVRYDNAALKYKEARDELHNARGRLKDAIRKNDKNATFEHAKNYLLRTSDALINHLEKIKIKLQENENIPDDREAQIVAAIDSQISEINSIKAEIQAATTKEQLKELAKKLRNKWNALQHWMRLYAYNVVSARVQGIVNQGKVLEKRLDHILEKANESGIEVDVSAEIEAFKAQIDLAKDKYLQAQDKIAEALALKVTNASSEQVKALADEAKALLKESRDALKQAHEILKDIIKKIKEAMPSEDLSAEVEVEQETSVGSSSGEMTATTETNVEATAST